MRTKVISTIAMVVILLMAGCLESVKTTTLVDDESMVTRFGVAATENIDYGMTTSWKLTGSNPKSIGAYATYSSPDFVIIDNPFGELFGPDNLSAVGYAGMQVGGNFDDEKIYGGPMIGLKVLNTFVVEQQYCSFGDNLQMSGDDESKTYWGLQYEIKF